MKHDTTESHSRTVTFLVAALGVVLVLAFGVVMRLSQHDQVYRGVKITVSYRSNGGSGSGPATSTYFSEDPGKASKNTFTRRGYTFIGWSDTRNARTKYYNLTQPGDELEFNDATPGESFTYYAQWLKNGFSKGDTFAIRHGNTYYLYSSFHAGKADKVITYGKASDQVLVGDWNADGTDTLAVRRGNRVYATNSPSGGKATKVFTFGEPDDTVLSGDWEGFGRSSLAQRRGSTYEFTSELGGEIYQRSAFGKPTDQVYVGAWAPYDSDSLAMRRGNTYYVTDSKGTTTTISFGSSTDTVLTGDWNCKDGSDDFAIRRGNTYYIYDSLHGGKADRVITFGSPTDTVLVGHWF
ncbi:MAG: InlB B-repeat-containing protein [Bifidobacterium sp.]|uniref:InlB B-repeat-containing protein n=1 Tax=Bifidobacterium sp. TaxID=41200 RepID=UPI0039E84B88